MKQGLKHKLFHSLKRCLFQTRATKFEPPMLSLLGELNNLNTGLTKLCDSFVNLSGLCELGPESTYKAENCICHDNFSRRVFLEGFRGWGVVLLQGFAKPEQKRRFC